MWRSVAGTRGGTVHVSALLQVVLRKWVNKQLAAFVMIDRKIDFNRLIQIQVSHHLHKFTLTKLIREQQIIIRNNLFLVDFKNRLYQIMKISSSLGECEINNCWETYLNPNSYCQSPTCK